MNRKLLPVKAAQGRILRGVRPLGVETVSITAALGRTLRAPIKAPRASPAADTSAMDGFAVRRRDLQGRRPRLKVVGESAAGSPYRGALKPGQAVRIFTGARLPAGSDTVVIQENTEITGKCVRILKQSPKGANVRKKGFDTRKGEVLAAAGEALNARLLGLLAATGARNLRVTRRPRVALIATGNELVAAGRKPKGDQIVNSNTPMMAALLEADGAEVLSFGTVRDSLKAIRKALSKAKRADLIVTMGGASVGKYDFVRAAVLAEGGALGFWRVAVKPGKPLMFGRIGRTPLIGLPGNPASTFVCAYLFVLPALSRMLGRRALLPPSIPAALGRPLPRNGPREAYLFGTLVASSQGWQASAFPVQDSSHLKALARGQCLIRRAPHAPPLKKGGRVGVYPLFS
jgi:molybdopterin molybdotransferase